MKIEVGYQEMAIQQLEAWGWNVECYRLYGLPWLLKLCLYPAIWSIRLEVQAALERIVKKERRLR